MPSGDIRVVDAVCNSQTAAWCPPTCETRGRPLRVACADTGFGNRILNWLAPAVYGRVLHRPIVTFWATPKNTGGRRHFGMRHYGELSALRELVDMPYDLQFIEDWPVSRRGAGVSSSKAFGALTLKQSDYVPVNSLNNFPNSMPGYGFFTPESAWEYWQGWAKHRVWPAPNNCTSYAEFALAFRAVFDDFRPRIDLQNPPPRSYLAMHVREGDKRRVSTDAAATVLRLAQHVSQRTGLSWLVISDNETAAAEVNAEMQRQGIAVLPPRVPLSISTASPSPPISLRAVVRDFFALSAAAGVLLQTSPFGGWIDSSFSSTAAAVGDAPLLLPARSAKGGSMASLQALTNASGLPLHSCFFKDQLEAFQQEVEACRKRPFKGPAR